jgi:hypothetical protein
MSFLKPILELKASPTCRVMWIIIIDDLAHLTYFWGISERLKDDLPWGVTANLIVRRVKDDISFDLVFPKTGGGEDIDFCIRKRDWFVHRGLQGLKPAPKVIVTHPWWNEGRRSYRHFFMWAKGDGNLASKFPQHCYIERVPNSAELGLYCFLAGTIGLVVSSSTIAFLGYWGVLSVLLTSISYEFWLHLSGKIGKDPCLTITGFCYAVAIKEASILRINSEVGRLACQIERGEFIIPFRPRPRFDWFVGRIGDGPAQDERNQNFQRFLAWLFLMSLVVSLTFF